MPQVPLLRLALGDQSWPLDSRPITIGRLPECDVVLDDDRISRNHAYLIPTPDGPLLVDRSTHGTRVNGEAASGPRLLKEGDELSLGPAVLQILGRNTPVSGKPAPLMEPAVCAKIKSWVRRYGPSELLGTIAAVGTAVAVSRATGSALLAAYAGTLAEVVVFYGIMFLRESIREAHEAGRHGRPYGSANLLSVFRNLGLEFGIAEALDSGLLRPFCMGIGIELLGGSWGALVGKLAADVAFYGPVLTIYEWRLARNHANKREDRRRRTTSAGIVIPPGE